MRNYKKIFDLSFWKRNIKRFINEKVFWNFSPKIYPFDFKKWDTPIVENSPPEKSGWKQLWHGYYQMEKVRVGKRWRKNLRPIRIKYFCKKSFRQDSVKTGEIEKQCFLSVLNTIKDKEIKMFELGAGRGDWCLTLAGTVDFNLIPGVEDKTYRCLAVEAEPTHYKWTKEHFEKQNINGGVVHGAIGDKDGEMVGFDISRDPAKNYGQSVSEDSDYKVKSYTVDWLIDKYNFPKVNIIHADLQGSELKAIKGAQKSIKQGLIDYWIIGTHERELEREIIELTKEFYDVIFYIPRRSGLINHSFYGQVYFPRDGLLILRHKN